MKICWLYSFSPIQPLDRMRNILCLANEIFAPLINLSPEKKIQIPRICVTLCLSLSTEIYLLLYSAFFIFTGTQNEAGEQILKCLPIEKEENLADNASTNSRIPGHQFLFSHFSHSCGDLASAMMLSSSLLVRFKFILKNIP